MATDKRWLLPDGVEEILPEQAWQLEQLRRELLDMYRNRGYELIITPFIEYLESLLTGTGNELDLKTFKLVDQLSGRQLGLRADITPQAARIDTHRLQRETPGRLCYLGTVLHARPEGFSGSRSPMQVGAELYGPAGADSDVEILALMQDTLELTGIKDVHIDLGHVGIYRGLARDAGLDAEQEAGLFNALQRKAIPEIDEFLEQLDISDLQRRQLAGLARLNGGKEVFEEARQLLQGSSEPVIAALDNLNEIATLASKRIPAVELYYDLAELRGYEYQTGIVFAAFVADFGQEIARGGRYDMIGRDFGSARPATGFSADLRTLIALGKRQWDNPPAAIFAPLDDSPALHEKVQALRAAGEQVIQELSGQRGSPGEIGCDRVLRLSGKAWKVEKLE